MRAAYRPGGRGRGVRLPGSADGSCAEATSWASRPLGSYWLASGIAGPLPSEATKSEIAAISLGVKVVFRFGDPVATGIRPDSVAAAQGYLARAIAGGASWRLSRTPETGHGPVDHLDGPHDRGVAL